MITPTFDLTFTTGVSFSFDYAYATNAGNSSEITESLKVYASRNCGQTWTLRKTITGAELVSMGYEGYEDRHPTNNSQWKTASFNYVTSAQDASTAFKLEFTASDFAGNLYIDNINISGVLSVPELENELDLVIAPNPLHVGDELTISYLAGNAPIHFQLMDLNGKILQEATRTDLNTPVQFQMATNGLQASCYLLEIQTMGYSIVKKVMIY